ncbi:MAG TPA: hypothetical protein EYQ42_05105 [Thiotrichaceae bacterium]|jgi:hypothetical protein|nr:hypothetical protein [Thiotrichaceae bacterium]HIM08657.1 hypothetical protein [Gammaproteobacteria bacterium]
MIPTNVMPFPQIQYSMLCGVCPKCGKSDGFVNLGKEHWFICRDHKTKWFAGVNMFEGWENQTVAQAQSIESMLNSYKDVVPLREVDGEHKLGNHVL